MKRTYPKIEIWLKHPGGEDTGRRFYGVTTWSKNCREAKARFIETHPELSHAADRVTCKLVKAGRPW